MGLSRRVAKSVHEMLEVAAADEQVGLTFKCLNSRGMPPNARDFFLSQGQKPASPCCSGAGRECWPPQH